MISTSLKSERCSGQLAQERRETVELIYRSAYSDFIASGEEFDSVPAFMERFDAYSANPALDFLIVYAGDTPVGQAWGWPLKKGSAWWSGISNEPEPGFTIETGARTFALSEIMVVPEWTGKGVAHTLHDTLLSGRDERRATLLVEPDNDTAYPIYLHWGWRKAATLLPDWPGAPQFDVLMLDLASFTPALTA